MKVAFVDSQKKQTWHYAERQAGLRLADPSRWGRH